MQRLGSAVLLLVLLAACGGGSDGASSSTTAGGVSSTSTTELVAGNATVDDLDLPREVTYAHLVVTVQAAEMSNADPGHFGEVDAEPTEQTLAYLTLVLQHEEGHPANNRTLPISAFSLDVDGREVDAVPTLFHSSLTVQPGTATQVVVGFAIAEADLADATLVIAEPGDVPARLPLSGPVPEDPYPVVVPMTGEGTVTLEGGCGDAEGTITPIEAAFDVDAGKDHDDERIVHAGDQRAKTDERFVRVTMQVVATAQACGAFVGEETFRLVVDGLPTAPINIFGDQVQVGAGREYVIGWTVPIDAESLVLEAGISGGTTAQFPIEIPAYPDLSAG